MGVSCSNCHNKSSSVFCDLSREHLDSLNATKRDITFKKREVVFAEGDIAKGVYCISSGKVKVYKVDPNGHQQIYRISGPGDIIGYRSILVGEPYEATAETIEDTTICYLDDASFLHTVETHPKTALNVMRLLASNLNDAEAWTMNMVHKTVRERLAEWLLIFKNKFGLKTADGFLLDIHLTREEFAEIIGTTTESVIRMMSDLKNEGLIALEGRRIIIKKIKELVLAAQIQD